MAGIPLRLGVAVGLATLVGAVSLVGVVGLAAAQTLYRYVDANGKVVYSDQPPPASAKEGGAFRVTPNTIEVDQAKLAVERAQQRFPVTLFTFACGETCERAEALLNRRGVPHQTVDVSAGDGAERLKKLSGDTGAPVLQVGDQLARGFSEPQWQLLLDAAGYPKAPIPRQAPAAAPGKAAAKAAPAPSPASGGYPKD